MPLSPSGILEAVLFAYGEPFEKKRLASHLGVSMERLEGMIADLRASLEARGLALVETAEELELRTAPDAADVVKKLREAELSRDLGKAGLEVLAIILYRGSATRSQIDWVRGVNSSATIRSLMLRGLIERSEDAADRRRARYAASIDALAHLGVGTREELPRFAEFAAALSEEEKKQEADETAPDHG